MANKNLTTEELRAAYVTHVTSFEGNEAKKEAQAAFDAWLETVKFEAREEGREEGYTNGYDTGLDAYAWTHGLS